METPQISFQLKDNWRKTQKQIIQGIKKNRTEHILIIPMTNGMKISEELIKVLIKSKQSKKDYWR